MEGNVKKARELRLARLVVAVRGGGIVAEEPGNWPDAWLARSDSAGRIPIEVVAAPPRPDGEPTNAGSRMVREQKIAEQRQEELVREGNPRPRGQQLRHGNGRGAGTTCALSRPANAACCVGLAAIRQKQAKNYDEAARTILIVDGVLMMRLWDWELRKLVAECDPFPEVWFCPEVSNDEAQRIR